MKALLLITLFLATSAQALTLDSGMQRATTVELFTSEGCSSCPPADQWLSRLKAAPGLFDTLIPLAFHVDYWDRLGWRDSFASKENTQRQRRHRQEGNLERVYTPGFVVDNREWRGFFAGQRLPRHTLQKAGRLQVIVEAEARAGRIYYQYRPADPNQTQWTLHVAYLLMGVCSEIGTGENRGRQLCHDFVVDSHQRQAMAIEKQPAYFTGTAALPARPDKQQAQTAIVVWVSRQGAEAIEQAVAAYL